MNLIDAVRSGKDLRRRSSKTAQDGIWLSPRYNDFSREDVLADDWEVREKEVTITKTMFFHALRRAMTHHHWKYEPRRKEDPIEVGDITKRLIHELGLED